MATSNKITRDDGTIIIMIIIKGKLFAKQHESKATSSTITQ